MKIAVIGTGYVGLVTSTCLAESGNDVIGVDKDAEQDRHARTGKIADLRTWPARTRAAQPPGKPLTSPPIWRRGVGQAKLIFIAVGTPQSPPSGAADLTSLWAVGDAMAAADLRPPGRHCHHQKHGSGRHQPGTRPNACAARPAARIDVASNPEFLKEGAAIDDFMKPDRVVVGVRRPEVGEVLQELYSPFLRTERPFLVMSPESAEMTKYAANAMLATKISFINEMANLCDRLGADINDVRRGIGHDSASASSSSSPAPATAAAASPKTSAPSFTWRKPLDVPVAPDRSGGSRQRSSEAGAARTRSARTYGNRLQGQDASPSGAWPSSRAPTTSAKPPPCADRRVAGQGASICASTIPRRWPMSKRSTATS